MVYTKQSKLGLADGAHKYRVIGEKWTGFETALT
jgi:hypothetical protein